MKPILFNTEMIQAILEDRKTVTRRAVKPQPKGAHAVMDCDDNAHTFDLLCGNGGNGGIFADWAETVKAPFWFGDILYVRETWCKVGNDVDKLYFDNDAAMYDGMYLYKADGIDLTDIGKWHPSIHMPKEAARLFLRVTDVRVERLQDMTEDDVCAEGAEPLIQCPHEHPTYGPDGTLGDMCWNTDCCSKCEYISKSDGELFGEYIWDSTIKKADLPLYGWAANPWVWVIEFERISKEESYHGET